MKTEKELEIKLRILDYNSLSPDLYDDFAGRLQKILGGKNNKQCVSIYAEPFKVLETAYYDTKALDLKKSKIAYRVRVDEGTKVATIKTDIPKQDKSSDIFAQRLEQTVTVPENINADDFMEIFRETEVLDILKPVVGRKSLVLLFTTKFDRKSYLIEQKNGYKILMCIDSGDIFAVDKDIPIHEIELELIDGEMEDIFDVAYTISSIIPVNAETTSKYARGLVLSGKVSAKDISKLKAVKKYTIPDRTESFEIVVKMAVSNILNNLIYYKYSIESHQSDYESVHAFRVLLRHLISISELAKSVMPGNNLKELRKLIKTTLKKSAKTREIDIFLHSWKDFLDATVDSLNESDKNISNKISGIITAYRQFERVKFQDSFSDGKFTELLLLTEKWLYKDKVIDLNIESDKDINSEEIEIVDNTKTANVSVSDIPGKDVLDDFIAERDSLISEIPKNLKSLKPKKLHKIRLAAKEKRYMLKYFDTGLSKDELAVQIENLKSIQDLLGELNDIYFNLDYSKKILPDCSLTDSYRKWLKQKQQYLHKSLEKTAEIEDGQ